MRWNTLAAPVPLLMTLSLACSGDDAADTGATDGATSVSTGTGTATATATATAGSTATTTDTGTASGTSDTGTTDPTVGETSTSTATTTTDPTTSDPTTSDPTTDTDTSTTGGVCPDGTIVCEDGQAKVCDGMGGYADVQECSDECADGIGCVLCVPDSYTCEGEVSLHCNEMGDAWEDPEDCDPLQGLSCDQNSGECLGACSKKMLGLNYIGCDYYPTVTPQYPGYQTAPHKFAVAVSNTSPAPATITVTQGANMIVTDMVPAGAVKTITLPWVNTLSAMDGTTNLYPASAYRLRSNQPVTVYQYNPLEAAVTNDASLLVPVNAWTGSYLIASWQHWDLVNRPGFYAVIASQPDTTVTFLPSATGSKVSPGAGVMADGTGMAVMQPSDVLLVRSATGGDLTGTILDADKPIHVISGHPCTNVPLDISACDHLEESMFPLETLAKEYFVVPPAQVPNDQLAKAQNVRIIASEDNTALTFTPDQPVGKVLAKAGDFVEITSTQAAFKVSADKKIAVSQYMVGQSGGFGTSDPAMLMSVAIAQYRQFYLFHAPPSWSANYVDIIAPDGTAATVDGVPVGGYLSIPGTGYSYAHVKLSNAGDGTHEVMSDQPVGISVYGVLDYGSYWYAGGLDLIPIPQ